MNNSQDTNASATVIRSKPDNKTTGKQPLRLFSCATCNHKLRFGASRCGQCWQPAPLYNQTRVYVMAAGAVVAGVVYLYLNFVPD